MATKKKADAAEQIISPEDKKKALEISRAADIKMVPGRGVEPLLLP